MHCLVLFLLFGVKFLYANELNDKQSHSKHLGVNRHAKHRLKMKQRKPWPGSVDNKNSSDVGDINAGDEFWVDSKYLREWYTNLDLCILQNTSNDTTQVIMAKCESEAMGRGEDLTKQPTRCRAGNSWPSKGEYCSSEDIPFSNRKTLYRSIIGYDDPSAKPLKTFFETSAKENGALLLVGDSVMQQFYAAMACELEREGLWSDPTQFTNTDELKHVTIGDMNVPIKFAPIYHFVNGRWDREANASMKALRKHVEGFVDSHHSLTILINMGLHYVSNPIAQFSREDYFIQMTGCLQYLNEIALLAKPEKKIRVLWRETSAQHFPTPNGYWPGVKFAASMKLTCNPISDSKFQKVFAYITKKKISETNPIMFLPLIFLY